MRKKLQLVAAFAAAFLAFNTGVNAQCTPDPQYAGEPFGLWPDSTENLPNAFAQQAAGYNTDINLVTLVDTVLEADLGFGVSRINAVIQKLRIDDVTGYPAGFSYAPNYTGTDGWVNTGTNPNFTGVQGCVNISANQAAVQAAIGGGPNNDGVYPIEVVVDVYITEATCVQNCLGGVVQGVLNSEVKDKWLGEGQFANLMPVIDYYRIVVENSTNVNIENALSINNVFPNPVRDIAPVEFTTSTSEEVQFRLFDMIGKEVYFENINSNAGVNTFKFDASHLPVGTYVYTINDGQNVAKSKLVVAGK